ncbi:GC-rich sequence DNA-binding factor-like protein-domain-containing protein [Mycena floridula]|nr:GC-rich sequence DNA-binding factor-like protein-domain-containing protein [Mycena floridula]
MGRRKRVLDDGDSDSSASSDHEIDMADDSPEAREERALFEDPYQRKRRRKNGKDEALYGIFAEDMDGAEESRDNRKPKRKSDWAKAPAFVSGAKKVDLKEDMDMDVDEEGEEHVESDNDSGDSPQISLDEEDEPPDKPVGLGSSGGGIGSKGGIGARGGIGSNGGIGSGGGIGSNSGLGARGGIGSGAGIGSKAGIGGSKGGIGSSNGGIGSFKSGISSSNSSSDGAATPSSFSSTPSSFARVASPAAPKLTPAERAHFNNLSGSYGARLLASMGWQAGTGLGVSGDGIVTPVESKLRPGRVGIAFQGFKEKTEQSKAEARRKGLAVSDDEDDPKVRKAKRQAREAKERRSDVWKKPKKVKTKVEHRTYEQIMAESGGVEPDKSQIIIDATGAVPKTVSSVSEVNLNSWAPSADPTRIPEVRHNIRLIADSCGHDLAGLAREARNLSERRKFVEREDARLRKKVEDEAALIARLQRVQLVVTELSAKGREMENEVSLDPLSPLLITLSTQFTEDIVKYRLDEIVVAVIAPVFRRMVAAWNPLEDPAAFVSTFQSWRAVLGLVVEKPRTEVDLYGVESTPRVEEDRMMTPFESLLWTVWLPKVRTCINNEYGWSPAAPQPAVQFYEAWSSFLPPFIRDNLLDQLILPKVQKAVADWNLKQGTWLQSIIFPWLLHLGPRMDQVLGDAKRKIKSAFRAWTVGSDIPMGGTEGLREWKEQLFSSGEWDALILKYVLPKLAACLRDDFRLNPRSQNMEPMERVLQWSTLIRSSIFSQLLETEFFPKWLDVLWIVQTTAGVSLSEIAEWYTYWKSSVFPAHVLEMDAVTRGFRRGLDLMNEAVKLGDQAATKLKRPDWKAELRASSAARNPQKPTRTSARANEITFKSIVEEFVADNDLLLMHAGRVHEKTGIPLYRVGSTGAKGGLLVYILDDAVWAPIEGNSELGDYRAIKLDDMVQRARSL